MGRSSHCLPNLAYLKLDCAIVLQDSKKIRYVLMVFKVPYIDITAGTQPAVKFSTTYSTVKSV